MCKVVKVVVSDDGTRREPVSPYLTVAKAMALRDKLDDKQERQDLAEIQEGGPTMGKRVVSYMVEGTV
jgi:hypothetical protein